MVAQSGHGILGSRRAMRIGRGSHSGISYRRRIERKQSVTSEFPIVDSGQLHEEVVWMLPVDDGTAEGGFSLLEELRIEALRHSGRLQAEHGAQRQPAWSELALGHGHKPVRGEDL